LPRPSRPPRSAPTALLHVTTSAPSSLTTPTVPSARRERRSSTPSRVPQPRSAAAARSSRRPSGDTRRSLPALPARARAQAPATQRVPRSGSAVARDRGERLPSGAHAAPVQRRAVHDLLQEFAAGTRRSCPPRDRASAIRFAIRAERRLYCCSARRQLGGRFIAAARRRSNLRLRGRRDLDRGRARADAFCRIGGSSACAFDSSALADVFLSQRWSRPPSGLRPPSCFRTIVARSPASSPLQRGDVLLQLGLSAPQLRVLPC